MKTFHLQTPPSRALVILLEQKLHRYQMLWQEKSPLFSRSNATVVIATIMGTRRHMLSRLSRMLISSQKLEYRIFASTTSLPKISALHGKYIYLPPKSHVRTVAGLMEVFAGATSHA